MTPQDLATLHAAAMTTPKPWSVRAFASLLDDPACFLLTAGDRAFLLGRAAGGEAEVLTLATHPRAQRLGLGRSLLLQFTQTAQARGAETAFLEVAVTNDAACALYAADGWRQVGLRPAYLTAPDGTRVDACVLSRPLTT